MKCVCCLYYSSESLRVRRQRRRTCSEIAAIRWMPVCCVVRSRDVWSAHQIQQRHTGRRSAAPTCASPVHHQSYKDYTFTHDKHNENVTFCSCKCTTNVKEPRTHVYVWTNHPRSLCIVESSQVSNQSQLASPNSSVTAPPTADMEYYRKHTIYTSNLQQITLNVKSKRKKFHRTQERTILHISGIQRNHLEKPICLCV